MRHLCHLHLSLPLGIFSVAVVIRFDHDEVAALAVDHELARRVLQWMRHLTRGRCYSSAQAPVIAVQIYQILCYKLFQNDILSKLCKKNSRNLHFAEIIWKIL